MSAMEDQPAPQAQLTGEALAKLVQEAANAVIQNLRVAGRNRAVAMKAIDDRLQETIALTTLVHCHLDALTKLLVAKGTATQDEINMSIVAEFASKANELAGRPQLVVPRL